MIDLETKERLRIDVDVDAGPYLMLPLEQVSAVQSLLQRQGVAFTVDDEAVQFDERPPIAIMNFGRGADPVRLQRLLDEAN
jgi:hypothetical protein